jgi:hypothetical protein
MQLIHNNALNGFSGKPAEASLFGAAKWAPRLQPA